jgi:pimeloyl-ACP methyl ester carboxylesterase
MTSALSQRLETVDGTFRDASRRRDIGWRATYVSGAVGCPVIFLSHGGNGSATAYRKALDYVRIELAKAGYVAISIQHRGSITEYKHRFDRPEDVSFLVTRLLANKFKINATIAPDLIGHVGHSWGAYTGTALAGGKFEHGSNFADPRITAFVAMSPQGPDQLGTIAETWEEITSPVFWIIGERELNNGGILGPVAPGWRRTGFDSAPDEETKFLAIVPGMKHEDLADGGLPSQARYIALNIVAFFDWAFLGSGDASTIGTIMALDGTEISNTEEE